MRCFHRAFYHSNAQEPAPVKTQRCRSIQLGVGNVIQGRVLAQRARQLSQPDTSVDLVKGRISLCTPILALRQRRRLRQPLPEALREGGVVFVGRVRAFVHARELFQVGKRFRRIDAAEFVEIIG